MMMKKAAIAGAVALAIAGANAAQAEEHEQTEKCFGVVKAGQNDCASATKSHSCMGHAADDANGDEWIAVPAGLCEKLVGGSLTPKAGGDAPKSSCHAKNDCSGKDMEKTDPADHEG